MTYKRELEIQHDKLPEEIKKFLRPCERCGKFLLLDFEICPICKHQQHVDDYE